LQKLCRRRDDGGEFIGAIEDKVALSYRKY